MRDLHLRHTLKTLARDASAVFADIIASGQEIPYEISEPDGSLAFCQYRPLTAKFVRDNATELRELDSFREATETMRRSDLAATYLEEAGIAPPADALERATLAVTYFLARLWDGCSDFEIDEDRFSAALDEVEECSEPEAGEVEAVVPLVGFQAPVGRIELKQATIVRADTVDVPAEAARIERAPGAEWEPTFLISIRIALDPEDGLAGAGDRVARTFERVVTTLRLFKPGGVGLGPHGWVRVAGDRWRRIATGAGRPRAGGYRLDEDEISALIDLARTVSVHHKRLGRLRRALLRFESGLDRRGAVDALNDHLLGLRFLLEGEGPAGTGLPMRAAALAADADERAEVKQVVEQALALERELWSGEPSGGLQTSPSAVATRLEDVLRTILRSGVAGEFGSDLRAAADETLLADGLALGEGEAARGATSEWELERSPGGWTDEEEAVSEVSDVEFELEVASTEPFAGADAAEEETTEHDAALAFERFETDPDPEIVASRRERPAPSLQHRRSPAARIAGHREEEAAEPSAAGSDHGAGEAPSSKLGELPDWLEEVDEDPKLEMEFPKPDPAQRENHIDELSKPPMEREEVRARVEYLFPRTETDWSVGKEPRRREARAG